MVLVEATDILNRDLAAHSGRLTVNAELMLQALAQRGLAPRLDEAIGRYRLLTTPLEEAIRLSPEAPYAPRARFALLKAHFYESFVLDPLSSSVSGSTSLSAKSPSPRRWLWLP